MLIRHLNGHYKHDMRKTFIKNLGGRDFIKGPSTPAPLNETLAHCNKRYKIYNYYVIHENHWLQVWNSMQ